MRKHRPTAVALELPAQPWPKDNRARKCNHAANRVNHSRTSKVVEALTKRRHKETAGTHCCQETIRPPGPVTYDRINKSRYRDTIKQVANEPGAANHRARSN